jgi:hypothetical protein
MHSSWPFTRTGAGWIYKALPGQNGAIQKTTLKKVFHLISIATPIPNRIDLSRESMGVLDGLRYKATFGNVNVTISTLKR